MQSKFPNLPLQKRKVFTIDHVWKHGDRDKCNINVTLKIVFWLKIRIFFFFLWLFFKLQGVRADRRLNCTCIVTNKYNYKHVFSNSFQCWPVYLYLSLCLENCESARLVPESPGKEVVQSGIWITGVLFCCRFSNESVNQPTAVWPVRKLRVLSQQQNYDVFKLACLAMRPR